MVVGVITGREIVSQWIVIEREFGWLFLARCLLAVATREPTTFVGLVMAPPIFRSIGDFLVGLFADEKL